MAICGLELPIFFFMDSCATWTHPNVGLHSGAPDPGAEATKMLFISTHTRSWITFSSKSARSRGRRGRQVGRPGHDVVWGGEVDQVIITLHYMKAPQGEHAEAAMTTQHTQN